MRDKLYKILTAPAQTTKEIRQLMEQMDTLAWSLIPGAIRYDTPKVQTSPRDRMADAFSTIGDAQYKLAQLDKRRRQEQEQIRALCVSCQDLTEQEGYIILKRYMYREKWESISYWLGLTDRRIFQIHGEALNKLELFLEQQVDKM